MKHRYFKPYSGTWWIGVVVLLSGVLLFVDAIYPLGFVGTMLRGAYGGVTPFSLLLIGAGTITGRGAMPDLRNL